MFDVFIEIWELFHQKKLCDRVDHLYLFSVLRVFGFGGGFLFRVSLLYQGIKKEVMDISAKMASYRLASGRRRINDCGLQLDTARLLLKRRERAGWV